MMLLTEAQKSALFIILFAVLLLLWVQRYEKFLKVVSFQTNFVSFRMLIQHNRQAKAQRLACRFRCRAPRSPRRHRRRNRERWLGRRFPGAKSPAGDFGGAVFLGVREFGRLQRPLLFDELVYLLDGLVQRAHFSKEYIEAYS